ncbi:MAG: 3-hydroxyacyl-ACP dehydratase FabZ [Candidatus Latescibacterota bacterium]|nr:3-hydroxyacyl-ACP dehydratase FabZ [Candidatus Latescibacterota bacterium]
MDIKEIQRLVPHRYPFLLIDRVLERTPGERAVSLKNVTVNEPFFQGHFPGHLVMPGVLIIEAIAQTALVMIPHDEGEKIPLFMGIDKARFRRQVVPGDQLRIEVVISQMRRNVCKAHGVATVEGEKAAEADILATIVDADLM